MGDRKYKDDLLEDLQDPIEAIDYLRAVVRENNFQMFLIAMNDVFDAILTGKQECHK